MNGLVNGRYNDSHIGLVGGLMGQHQQISEVNTFIFTIRTTSTRTLELPLISIGVYNFFVDWGDGKKDHIRVFNQSNRVHTYPTALRDYTIKITGVCRGWSYFGFLNERDKILTIERWGCLELRSLGFTANDPNLGIFGNCRNLDLSNVKDGLNTRILTDLHGMFYFNKGNINLINNWNVSNMTGMAWCFANNVNFNQPLNSWNTGNVTFMIGMFYFAASFNQELNNWNTSNVITMSQMFQNASNFNQPIDSWNTGAVTNMSQMFQNASNFNQDIGNWNVSQVTDMIGMFYFAASFNQELNNWNTSNVITMSQMFQNASNFNQPIDSWNTGAVTNMSQMFQNASNFNQDIGNWNVSQVTNMNYMFYNANNFNQNISNWNVSQVNNFVDFMGNQTQLTFSTTNLDAIFNGWINYKVKTDQSISFGSAKYTSDGLESLALLTRIAWYYGLYTIESVTNNGVGLIRITGFYSYVSGFQYNPETETDESVYSLPYTNMKIFIEGVTGTTEANGVWAITVIDTTTGTVDLIGSTFSNTYVSGGLIFTGYGWTVGTGGMTASGPYTLNIENCSGDLAIVYSSSSVFLPGVYIYTNLGLTIPFSGSYWNTVSMIGTVGGYTIDSNGLILNGLIVCN